ncbi:MAG TPA: PAS domain-containing sensor histidine kinase, partial [Spirochaetes bacterium]|nr:PAS domain-containing sensor histidine kinase [Spirochaetota bacterium]
ECSQINKAPYHWFDLTLKTKSGKKVYTQFNTTTMGDRSGQAMKSFSFITDITELKDKNDALRESEERLQAILLSSPDILLVLDEDLQVNEIFTARNDLLWMPKDDMLGQDLKSISGGKAYEAIIAGLKKLKKTPEPVSIEYSVNINGHTKWFSALASKLVSRKASEGKIILVLRDQTEQKRIERLREDVERIVRHDLKSPLNGIIGYSQMLLKDSLSDGQRKKVRGIHDEGNSMLHMINYSLDLFKMEEGTYIYTPEEVDIVQILSKIDNELTTLKDARHLHAEYDLMEKPIDWEQTFFIPGESMLLTNLFANLIKNALEASPDNGTITVSISEKKDFHAIDIHNMGIIPKEVEKRFFDRYTTTKKYGTGIGTYSAFLITKVHRGRIEFTSSQGEGTHLLVSLPKQQGQKKAL